MVHQQTDQVFDAQSVPVERVCQYWRIQCLRRCSPRNFPRSKCPRWDSVAKREQYIRKPKCPRSGSTGAEKSSSRLYSQNIDKQQCREDHFSFQVSKLLFVSVAHCEKYRHFTQFPSVEILWKGAVSAECRANRCVFPQNFHARKLGEITVFYTMGDGNDG